MTDEEMKRPSPVNGEFLHFTDRGGCWIGETYETAAIILERVRENPSIMRAIFYNRADPQQRRQTCFFDAEKFAEWAVGVPEAAEETQ